PGGGPPQRSPGASDLERQGETTSYFNSTLPPASSSSALSLSPSSRSMPSLTGLGASSTSALASLRPRPVAARTTLITWIFLSPEPVRIRSTVLDSSSSAPAPSPPPAGAATGAATAAADTPNSSSSALIRSASSSTEMPFSSSIQSCVLVAMFVSPPWWDSPRDHRAAPRPGRPSRCRSLGPAASPAQLGSPAPPRSRPQPGG